jgi:hypothetical protein
VPERVQGGHGGGDYGLLEAFVGSIGGSQHTALTSARESVESHLMAFAAEASRLSGAAVDMRTYRAALAR